MEASCAWYELGKTMRKVILPQAFGILPPLGNNAIAIVSPPSLPQLVWPIYAKQEQSPALTTYWEPYLTISVIYWMLTFILAQLVIYGKKVGQK